MVDKILHVAVACVIRNQLAMMKLVLSTHGGAKLPGQMALDGIKERIDPSERAILMLE